MHLFQIKQLKVSKLHMNYMIAVWLLLPWVHRNNDEPGGHGSVFEPQLCLAELVFSYPPIHQSMQDQDIETSDKTTVQ